MPRTHAVHTRSIVGLSLLIGTIAPAAAAIASTQLLANDLSFEHRYDDAPAAQQSPSESADNPFTLFGPSGKPYGTAGSKAWTIGGLYANNFNEASDINLHVAWSNFLADELEFAVEAAGWYFNQPGKDTGGVSGSMVFRWHFAHADDFAWSVFADGGIGILGAFDETPEGGTEFNFLPRVGLGATFRLSDEDAAGQAPRLMIGARWHHISNARIRGDSDNPARDSLAGYVGIVLPF